jgi:hypothetical protein
MTILMTQQIGVGGITVVGVIVVVSNFIAQSVAAPFLKAYLERIGEGLATKQDIKDVLANVKAITEAQEKIKAEISGGAWHWQWLLQQKRDAYVQLINTLETIRVTRGNIRWGADGPSREEGRRRLKDGIAEFRRARALARLLVSPDGIKAMRPLPGKILRIDAFHCTQDKFHESQQLIGRVRDRVVEIGKRDLEIVSGGGGNSP